MSVNSQANVTDSFNAIRQDRNALYQWLKIMPKGGELHYHLMGGAYPETMLQLAATGNYCLDTTSFVLSKPSKPCQGLTSKEIFFHPLVYSEVVKSWSFKEFNPGKESAHDHFFNVFDKISSLVMDFRPELLADTIQRAEKQHEHYLEIMMLPDNAKSAQFGSLLKGIKTDTEKRQLLLANKEFQANITYTIEETDRILNQARKKLGCQANPQSEACKVQVKFLYYVLREQSLDGIYAQMLNAFEAVSRSQGNLVGVNFVQAEDGPISIRDYHQHMALFNLFHQLYPRVNIALHAGELTSALVDAKDLSFHINEAVNVGHAQRIGHGVDIMHEYNAPILVNYMAQHQIPVEINLMSNNKILNMTATQHPLNYYLGKQVPVVLSTDDEGILRTDLTEQYVSAVVDFGLSYPQIKQINRNALSFAFLPGKSIWVKANKPERVQECADLNATACKIFIKTSEKARLQWDFEQALIEFENGFKRD